MMDFPPHLWSHCCSFWCQLCVMWIPNVQYVITTDLYVQLKHTTNHKSKRSNMTDFQFHSKKQHGTQFYYPAASTNVNHHDWKWRLWLSVCKLAAALQMCRKYTNWEVSKELKPTKVITENGCCPFFAKVTSNTIKGTDIGCREHTVEWELKTRANARYVLPPEYPVFCRILFTCRDLFPP